MWIRFFCVSLLITFYGGCQVDDSNLLDRKCESTEDCWPGAVCREGYCQWLDETDETQEILTDTWLDSNETTPDSDFKTTSYTGTLASTDKSVLSNKLVASTDKAAVNRLYPQTNISDDVLTRRKQEGKDLWGNLDDLNSKNNHQPQQAKDDHNLEIDRLMVLVDHKRTFKEESRFNSKSGPGKNPIIIAGLAIVLVVIVLALVMVLGLF